MSSESLNQNEIDALLGGSGAAAAPRSESPQPVAHAPSLGESQTYDFRRPHRISKEKRRSLQAMYERLSKSLEGWLLSRVRGGIQLQLQSIEHFSFGEFTLSLPTPCASYTFEVNDTGGQHGVVDIGHEFAYLLIDRLFGGSADPAMPSRAMTPIERMAVRGVAERVVALVQEVWQDYVGLDLSLVGFESIPEILRVANREDPMLVANFEIVAGDVRSLLVVCLPFAVLESFFAGGNESRDSTLGSPAEREQNRTSAEDTLRGTTLRVSARLPSFQVSMRDLLNLQTGSVLSTGVRRTTELQVLVGTQRRFSATPGRVGTALAVRISDGLHPAPELDVISLLRE